jgi:YVTN family beta-propeller protein
MRVRLGSLLVVGCALSVLAGCSARHGPGPAPMRSALGRSLDDRPSTAPSIAPRPKKAETPRIVGLPGMPAVTDPKNVYSEAGRNMLSATARQATPLVYVPHNKSGDVWVINPKTFRVVDRYPAGVEIQHVVPAYDMRTLYATDDVGNTILPIDPKSGKPKRKIPVIDPYNMYFTPDGKFAISVAEERRTLVWYDPHRWTVAHRLMLPRCAGVDHAAFSLDGRTAVFTCEFAGRVAVVDVASRRLRRMVDMPVRHTVMGPQDITLAPDGSAYYIADSDANGVWVLNGSATRVERFIATGKGAHGLYFSRDAKRLFVTNRHEGSISVLDAYTGRRETKWRIPGGGSPDMGNVTADGSQLWVSGRYDNVVYVISTSNGRLIKKIPVGNGPHGLCVWPQPGRYSLGHTGITR